MHDTSKRRKNIEFPPEENCVYKWRRKKRWPRPEYIKFSEQEKKIKKKIRNFLRSTTCCTPDEGLRGYALTIIMNLPKKTSYYIIKAQQRRCREKLAWIIIISFSLSRIFFFFSSSWWWWVLHKTKDHGRLLQRSAEDILSFQLFFFILFRGNGRFFYYRKYIFEVLRDIGQFFFRQQKGTFVMQKIGKLWVYCILYERKGKEEE